MYLLVSTLYLWHNCVFIVVTQTWSDANRSTAAVIFITAGGLSTTFCGKNASLNKKAKALTDRLFGQRLGLHVNGVRIM